MHNNRNNKGADIWKNGGQKQEGKATDGMARRHHQVGRDVASETEPDGDGQRKLEEVDETGIGHLRPLSPWLLMMMMSMFSDLDLKDPLQAQAEMSHFHTFTTTH